MDKQVPGTPQPITEQQSAMCYDVIVKAVQQPIGGQCVGGHVGDQDVTNNAVF